MSENVSPLPTKKVRRWLGPALLVSLVVNLFLLGVIATAIHHNRKMHTQFNPPPSSFFAMLHRGAQDLPQGDRAAMRNMMVRGFPIIRPYFAKIDEARRDLAIAIGTEPFDPVKVDAAFAKIDAVQAEMTREARGAMIKGFSDMSAAQRDRIAEMMRHEAEDRLKRLPPADLPPPGDDRPGPPPPSGPPPVDGSPAP